eukprot:Em0001g2728a
MSLRLLSANWGPPTHACITFEDGSPSVVPTKKIVDQSNLKVNDVCEVRWTDGKGYRATIVALGGREKMEAKLAEMAEEVDSEDTEKEDQRSGGSEVKQKGSSAVASTSKVFHKSSAFILDELKADIMQLKAQVLCLQKQVTYLLTIKAQTESTDSSADQSSQCGSDASKIRIKGCAGWGILMVRRSGYQREMQRRSLLLRLIVEYIAALMGTLEYMATLMGTLEYMATLMGTLEYMATLMGTSTPLEMRQMEKTKKKKKKPSPKLQAQEPPVTKPAPPSESDPPETKAVGSSKPSDISGHQEVKPKTAETKGASRASLPPTNAGLGTLLSSTSNIGLGLPPFVASLGALQMGLLPPSAAGLGTLPPNGGLGTLQPNGGLGTLPPNGGLGTMPPSAGTVLPNLGLPVQPPPLSQLPHIVSYPNLSNMASSSSGQPEQTKKFEISEVSEGSPVTLVPEPHPQAGGFLPAESQALFNEAFGQFMYNMHCLFTTPTMQPLLQQLSNHFGKRADTVGEVSSLSTSSELTSRLPSSQPVAPCTSDEHGEEDDQDDSDEEEGDNSENDGDQEYVKLITKFNVEKQQLEERRRQALEEYKKNKDAKRRLVTNTLHHSLRQGAEVNSSPDRLFHSAPAGGRETTPQYTPTRPAKKSSLEKKNTAKTYAEVTTTNVEKEGVDKKSRPEPVNPERDNMQKKVVAELATSLVNRKPQQQQKRVAAPTVGTANAGGGGVGGGKEKVMRSGSVGNNLAGPTSAMGGTQTSQGIVESTSVAKGCGPVAGSTTGGGGGGYSSVSGTSANSTMYYCEGQGKSALLLRPVENRLKAVGLEDLGSHGVDYAYNKPCVGHSTKHSIMTFHK